MPIAYIDTTGKTLIAHLAPGATPEQAASAMQLAPGSWRETTDEEAVQLQKPAPEEIQQQAANNIQIQLDEFARTRGYDSILSACTYAASTNPQYRAEGQFCGALRDAVRGAFYSGTELPPMEWPA